MEAGLDKIIFFFQGNFLKELSATDISTTSRTHHVKMALLNSQRARVPAPKI